MTQLRDRPTADVVIITMAGVVAFVIILSTIGLMTALALGHSPDVQALAKAIGELTGSLIALLVGYLAGRGVTGNGKPPPPAPPEE